MPQTTVDPLTGHALPGSSQAATTHSRLDNWELRTRKRADSTVGYSRFVRIMKVMLPIIAFSLIVLVVVYSSGGREPENVAFSPREVSEITQDRALVNPKLTGTDGRGQPFTVTAKGASLAAGKSRRMTIDEVKADITMQDRSWVQVGAVQGVLDVDKKTLDLTQTINIYSDRGYECHTDSARYDFGSGILQGDTPIRCQGPLGVITAEKFEGLRDPGVLKFTGGVTTNYFPAARQGEAAEAAVSNPEGIAVAVPEDDGAAAPSRAVPPTTPKKKPNQATP